MNLRSSSSLPKIKDEAQPSKEWKTIPEIRCLKRRLLCKSTLWLLNLNFMETQFPGMKDKLDKLEANASEFWIE